MKFPHNIFYVICVFLIISCSKTSKNIELALVEAGNNRPELEKVLNHYKINDSLGGLKYEAALFLIENMPNHSSYITIQEFDCVFDSISDYYPNNERGKHLPRHSFFKKMLDSVSKSVNIDKSSKVSDVKNITADFLISNIDLSFNAWSKIPENKRASFEDFCNYILPYKSSNEPMERYMREKMSKEYSWVHDYFSKGASLRNVVDSVISVFNYQNMPVINKYYPSALSMSQVEKSKVGLCGDGVNYLVNLFRSLGLICAEDMVSHWGNHPSSGHSWIFVKYGDEEYSANVGGVKIDLKMMYKLESIPKVTRTEFASQKKYITSPFQKDVTTEYVPTVDIDMENIFNASNSLPVLCVFDFNSKWTPISLGEYKNNNNKYNDVGINVLYLAANIEEGNIVPINYPFFINNNKKLEFFKPTESILDSVGLTRKIGLSSPRNRSKISRIKNINGGIFQGSNNPDFKNPKTLYKITNFNSTQINGIKLNVKEKFKYVRFYSNKKESFLARLVFYDAKGLPLEGKVLRENTEVLRWENGAFDNNPLSYSGGKDFSLGLKFNEPKLVSSIEFQARNDDNHINIGEEYELFYWEKDWKSLGRKVAKDTVLHYNIPANSLLWLRNLTKGKEEHVFTINENKKQRWLGFDGDF